MEQRRAEPAMDVDASNATTRLAAVATLSREARAEGEYRIARRHDLGPDATAHVAAKPSFYKPELDILRFVAFLGVFLVHIADYPLDFLVEHHVPLLAAKIAVAIAHAGAYGVDVFFVLSAYLITELLLREKDTCGSLHVRAFYLRRILRIWPLYYLFVALVVLVPFLNPHHELSLHYVIPFLGFMGNWSFVAFGWPNSVAVPLWSVSIEEQFYLLWPPVLARLSRRQIAFVSIALICVANLSRLLAVRRHESTLQLWGNSFAHLDSIGAGILLAVLMYKKVLPLRHRTRFALVAWGGFCLAARGHFVEILANQHLSLAGTLIGYPAVVLACVSIVVAFVGSTFRSGVFQYLGKISYGLYVYHLMCIAITDRLLAAAFGGGVLHASARMIIALGITVAISALSYAVMEKPFLTLKRRFTYVDSRPA